MEFNLSHPLNAYTGSQEDFGHSGSFYPEQGMNGDFQQPMWPSNVPRTPPNSPALYFSNADSVALPFMYGNYNVPMPLPQSAFAADFQADIKPLNPSQYSLCNGCIGAEAHSVDGLQYSTLPVYSSGVPAQNYAVQLQSNAAQFAAQSYTDYSPTMEKSSYGFRQATFHTPNYCQDSAPVTMPLHFAQPYIHNATTDYTEAVRETSPYHNNNTRWVNLDSTAANTGFKTPARNATKASEKKAPAKPSTGVKKPRHKVTYKDREMLFRSCVTKLLDRCFWHGCKDIVFTDRKSITEHMQHVHGLDITLDFRVGCRWKGCERDLKTKSLFRHITNSHMHVVEAHCLYGCGEVFSRIDGRSRHMVTCPRRPQN
ncbi:hypothetical protein M378DRAFT_180880 [Amanita muscaria Koide BX008]|uniref:C2H2-type domain-containing protein n=1 Tax=Amanita muscaria (strain Koide BX008) TaxID=946122 RepID=A0A0C2WRB4_AMAMK|nr:hypothetical protein M378DRAFT_180880 [Amanita muscaria Koide BX008]